MICPSIDDIHNGLLSLLPRGRAWGGTLLSWTTDNPVYRFWRSIAAAFYDYEQLCCTLLTEYFPDTANQTLDLWFAEYGLPDACDPYPNLVAKVRAAGGSRCDYFQDVAATAGWVIACVPDLSDGMGLFQVGCDSVGYGIAPCTLLIRVWLSSSSAYTGNSTGQAMVTGSNWGAGLTLGCGPDLTPLICLLSRIIPAHLAVNYEVIS